MSHREATMSKGHAILLLLATMLQNGKSTSHKSIALFFAVKMALSFFREKK